MSILKANRIENLTTTDGGINVNNSGNVGIGTASPHGNSGTNLHIHGSNTTAELRLTNTTTGTGANGSIIQQGGNTLYISNSEAGSTAFENNGSERLRINSSGNVGIGTSSPSRPLSVLSSQIGARFTSTSADSQIEVVDTSGTVVFGSSSGNAIVQAGGSERLRIDSSGRVGIGVSSLSSSSRLTLLESTGNAQTLEIKGANSGGAGSQPGIKFTASSGDNIGGIFGDTNTDAVILQTGGTERARLDSSGRLLVGATSGSYDLEVKKAGSIHLLIGSTNAAGAILILDGDSNGDGSGTDYASVAHASSGHLEYSNRKTSGDHIFSTTSSNTERMRILSSGGLTFNGDTSSDNALDDYEEGTFTPAFSFSNLSVSSYHTQQGSYIKVGRIVHVSVYVRFSGSNLSGTPTTGGAVYINLPFAGGTKYNDTQYLSEPAAIGRLAEFRGSNDSTDFDRIFNYIGNTSSSMYFAVNKQPCNPQSTDFLYGMSEKSFNGLIGVSNNFEYRHSFTYESSS